jgi:tryptophan-rich sensory protein
MKSMLALIGFIGAAFLAAASGFIAPPGDWYASLDRPPYAPPDWVFGPVWTLLYFLMAISAWLIWRRVGLRHPAMLAWGIQLILNASWTPIFFGLNLLGWALIQLSVLWLAIVVCVREFGRIDRTSARLLWPYLAWVSFAWVLNLGFWWLN